MKEFLKVTLEKVCIICIWDILLSMNNKANTDCNFLYNFGARHQKQKVALMT